MFTLCIDSYFWTSHSVPLPDGKSEPLHSHNFCATAKITAEKLDEKAMVANFCLLKKYMDKITENIVQIGNIGRIDYFKKNGQTTEILARYIFESLRTVLPQGVCLAAVTVAEEPGCRAEYSQ